MDQTTSSLLFRGIVPPVVTPLLGDDQLDVPGLERLLEHILQGGVQGLFILGTSGESSSLSSRLRTEVVEHAIRIVRGRSPVLVGITDTAFAESVRLGRFAAERGAQVAVVAAPYQFPADQADLRAYLRHLLSEVPLPIMLYHFPPLTRTGFDLETVRWAMDQRRIIGFKDSSGDLPAYERLCALLPRRPDWSLLAGPEEHLAATVALGGHGGICGGANVFPGLYTDLYAAAVRRDNTRIAELQQVVMRVVNGFYKLESHPAAFIKGLKCALACLGICGDRMAEPFRAYNPEQRVHVQRVIDEIRGLKNNPARCPAST